MLQPDFSSFPELHTERLILRKILPADAAAIYKMRSNKEVMKYVGKKPFVTIAEARAFINTVEEALLSGEGITWAIALKERPENLIGTIGHWRIIKAHYRAEVGYTLQQEYWRQGIVKEALLKIIDYGFNLLQLHSLEAHINPANIASAKVLESVGFIKEAHFKGSFFFDGKFEDAAVYSRLNVSPDKP